MSNIVQLTKNGSNEYPITLPEAVIDSEGKTVKDKIESIEKRIKDIIITGGGYDDTEIKEQINNKIDKGSLATINGQSIEEGGNIEIKGGSSIKSINWDAVEKTNESYISAKPFGLNTRAYCNIESTESGEYKSPVLISGDALNTFNRKYFTIEGVSGEVFEILYDGIERWAGNRSLKYKNGSFSNPNGNNYKIYIGDKINSLPENYIPNTITRNSDLPIGSGTNSILQKIDSQYFEDKNPILAEEGVVKQVKADAVNKATALGGTTRAGGKRSVSQGHRSYTEGEASHVEGHCNAILVLPDTPLEGYASHAEGYGNLIVGNCSHAEGSANQVYGNNSHSEGRSTFNNSDFSHTEGYQTYTGNPENAPERPNDPTGEGSGGTSNPDYTPAEGTYGEAAHAEGNYTVASGHYSHAEGRQTDAIGEGSHSEGTETQANGDYSHTEGKETTTNNPYSHAEGISTTVNAAGAHTEGLETVANAESSHAEGWACSTQGAAKASHAEGQNCHTYDIGSHAEGQNTKAYGAYSHVEGYETQSKAGTRGQHVEGKFNHISGNMIVIGCGSSDTDRKNVIEVTEWGDVFVKGIGGYDGTNDGYSSSLKTVIDNIINNNIYYIKSIDWSDLAPRLESDGYALDIPSTESNDLRNAISSGMTIRMKQYSTSPSGYYTMNACELSNEEVYLYFTVKIVSDYYTVQLVERDNTFAAQLTKINTSN